MTTASFKDIRKKISENINQSKETILVSVAWLTSKDLLGKLTDRLEDGCKVEIIISDHHENKRLNYDDFIKKGGQVFIVPVKSGKFLHDKFALFDNTRLIAGSYNWTNSAEFYNHEFVIQSDETQLIKQFAIRFKNLKEIVTKYDKLALLSNDYLNSEIANKEEEFIKLEQELENEFLNSIEEANKLGAKINSTNVISFIHRYGAIGAANRLINAGTDKLQSGLLKLWELQKLDISFESVILREKYKILFDEATIKKAQKRLDELN